MVRFSVFFICSYGGLHIENGDKGGGFGPVGVSCTAGGQNWDMNGLISSLFFGE